MLKTKDFCCCNFVKINAAYKYYMPFKFDRDRIKSQNSTSAYRNQSLCLKYTNRNKENALQKTNCNRKPVNCQM